MKPKNEVKMPVDQLDWFSRLLTINPSWSMVSVVLIIALIWLLSKNTAFTKTILESITIVKQIRDDQVKSNKERESQSGQIAEIKTEIGAINLSQKDLNSRMERIEKHYPICLNNSCLNRDSNETIG